MLIPYEDQMQIQIIVDYLNSQGQRFIISGDQFIVNPEYEESISELITNFDMDTAVFEYKKKIKLAQIKEKTSFIESLPFTYDNNQFGQTDKDMNYWLRTKAAIELIKVYQPEMTHFKIKNVEGFEYMLAIAEWDLFSIAMMQHQLYAFESGIALEQAVQNSTAETIDAIVDNR